MRRITVGIPFYNAGGSLKRAVMSALHQYFDGELEILLLDDGSTDEGPGIARALAFEYPANVRYERIDHAGVAAGRNAILDLASGSLIAWLDADDWYYPGHLATCLAALQHENSNTMAMSNYVRGQRSFQVAPLLDKPLQNMLTGDLPGYLWATLCSLDALRRVGKFDESLHRCEDQDFIVRFLLSGGKIVAASTKPTVHYDHMLSGRSGEAAEYAMKVMLERYSDEYNALPDRRSFEARRYWELSNFYRENQKWDDMWRSRQMSMTLDPATAVAGSKRAEGILLAHIRKLEAELGEYRRSRYVKAALSLRTRLRSLTRSLGRKPSGR